MAKNSLYEWKTLTFVDDENIQLVTHHDDDHEYDHGNDHVSKLLD